MSGFAVLIYLNHPMDGEGMSEGVIFLFLVGAFIYEWRRSKS